MSGTKKRILAASRLMFNKHGYDQVTIRMIALKVNMSSGNLNYHYKKREDILEAIYFEMHDGFNKNGSDTIEGKTSILLIKHEIQMGMNRMLDYKFFWTDLYNILKVSSKVRDHFQEFHLKQREDCFKMFTRLMNQGLMMRPSFRMEHDFLAELMISFGNNWLYSTQLKETINFKESSEEKVEILLTILYPYLTFQGKNEFQLLFPTSFEQERPSASVNYL